MNAGLFQHLLIAITAFSIALFYLLGGPHWLITRTGALARGRRSPRWLGATQRWVGRPGGAIILLYWSWTVAKGNVLAASLLVAIFLIGLFILLRGPAWVATRSGAFARGREAPRLLQEVLLWSQRLIGGGAVLSGLLIGVLYMVEVAAI